MIDEPNGVVMQDSSSGTDAAIALQLPEDCNGAAAGAADPRRKMAANDQTAAPPGFATGSALVRGEIICFAVAVTSAQMPIQVLATIAVVRN